MKLGIFKLLSKVCCIQNVGFIFNNKKRRKILATCYTSRYLLSFILTFFVRNKRKYTCVSKQDTSRYSTGNPKWIALNRTLSGTLRGLSKVEWKESAYRVFLSSFFCLQLQLYIMFYSLNTKLHRCKGIPFWNFK